MQQLDISDKQLLSSLGFQDDQEEDAASFKIEQDQLILGNVRSKIDEFH